MADLISRAEAIAEIEEYIEEYSELEPETGYHNLKWCAMEEAKDVLSMLPAVDAAPVVHAWWIETTIPSNTTGHGGVGQDKKKGRLCSNCKCAFDAVLLWCDSFCPNCGAKMDGERRESE